MNNITVWYCKKCGWRRIFDEFVVCVNECPNCLDKNLHYIVRNTREEVDNFFIVQAAKEQDKIQIPAITFHSVIRLWPNRSKIVYEYYK
jgi:hypothetical protein